MGRVEYDRVSKQFPGQPRPAVDELALEIPDGELLVFLGPSGCGKTTALRMLAGLEWPDRGDIRIDGRSVVALEPKDRDVALVFQSYALYPHMTVHDNLLYPLKVRRMSGAERKERVARVAGLLGLTPLLARKPAQLSGGEQQRVALGRAIVRQPRVFLMDEPLSNLDAKLRTHMRTEIKALQRQLGVTTIFVTHDQAEAMTLADRIAVFSAGQLQQLGSPDEIYNRPANLFVADFIGSPPMNLLEAERRDGSFVTSTGWRLPAPNHLASFPRQVKLGLRPEAIALTEHPVADAPAAEVVTVEPLGSEVIVNVAIGPTLLRVRTAPGTPPRPGQTVYPQADPRALHIFDANSGQALA